LKFEAKKLDFKNDLVLGPCINSSWSKLVKYYDKTSDSPAYVAALVLNPAYKWEYIEKTWSKPGYKEQKNQLWAFGRPSIDLILVCVIRLTLQLI
jgi:hypothetical protein